MKNTIKYLIGVLILLTVLSCQTPQNQNSNTNEKSFNQDLVNDIDTLKYWILNAHGDPFRFTTPDKLNHEFQKAKASVKKKPDISSDEFAGLLLPIIAELRDGHAQVFPANLNEVKDSIYFPLQFLFVDDKPFVIKNLSNKTINAGAEIVTINGENAEAYFKNILPYMHRDGDIETVRYRRLQNIPYLTRVLRFLGKVRTTYTVKIKNENGSVEEHHLKGLSPKQYQLKTSRTSKPFEALTFHVIDSLKSTALLDINSFNPTYYPKQRFYSKIDSVIRALNTSKINNLIIDLRNNTGGEDSYSMYLLRYLLNETFSYGSEVTFVKNNYKFLPDGKHWDIDPKCFIKNEKGTYDATKHLWEDHPTLGSFKPYENHYKGKVLVLINAFTFSAAADFASRLHYHKRALFIGEETGGSYIGNVSGYIPTLDLPNSKVKINLPLISTKAPFFEERFTNRGVIPDIEVLPTVLSVINSRDNAFEEIVKHLD